MGTMGGMVFKQRDDLPQMRLPTVCLMFVLTVFGGALGACMVPEDMFAALLFLFVAIVSYAMLILLWRSLVSLLVVPLMAGVIFLLGGGPMPMIAGCLSILVIAYVYATCCMAQEGRFVRMTSVAIVTAICVFCTAAAWCSSRYDSLSDVILEGKQICRDLFNRAYQTIGEISGTTEAEGTASVILVLTPESIDRFFYQILAALPSLFGICIMGFTLLFDGVCVWLLRLFQCKECFIPSRDSGITLPRSFGWVYVILLIMTMTTSVSDTPRLYSILSNCHWVFAFPCAGVGITWGYRRLREKIDNVSYYKVGNSMSRLPAVMLLVVLILFIGLAGAVTAAAALGAIYVIRFRDQEKIAEDSEK